MGLETRTNCLTMLAGLRYLRSRFSKGSKRLHIGSQESEAHALAIEWVHTCVQRKLREVGMNRGTRLEHGSDFASSEHNCERALALRIVQAMNNIHAAGTLISVCRKTPFLEFEPASAVKFDPDLTGGFRVKWTWSATFGGKRRAGGDFGAHIGDFWKYRAWRAAGSPVRAALARFPGDVRQLFVAGT